jgi:hypothetical protein
VNLIGLLGDARFWGALVSALLTWFAASSSGQQIVGSLVQGIVGAIEKRHPAWQEAKLRQIAADAVQLAFQVGGLASSNSDKKDSAVSYMQAEAAKYGIKVDTDRLGQYVDLVWGILKSQVLAQHAEAAVAKDRLSALTATATPTGQAASDLKTGVDLGDEPPTLDPSQPPVPVLIHGAGSAPTTFNSAPSSAPVTVVNGTAAVVS